MKKGLSAMVSPLEGPWCSMSRFPKQMRYGEASCRASSKSSKNANQQRGWDDKAYEKMSFFIYPLLVAFFKVFCM